MKDFNKINLLTAIVLSLATFFHFYRLVSNNQLIIGQWNNTWISIPTEASSVLRKNIHYTHN